MYDLEVFKLKKGNASLSHNQNILESSNYTGLETSATASFLDGTGKIYYCAYFSLLGMIIDQSP